MHSGRDERPRADHAHQKPVVASPIPSSKFYLNRGFGRPDARSGERRAASQDDLRYTIYGQLNYYYVAEYSRLLSDAIVQRVTFQGALGGNGRAGPASSEVPRLVVLYCNTPCRRLFKCGGNLANIARRRHWICAFMVVCAAKKKHPRGSLSAYGLPWQLSRSAPLQGETEHHENPRPDCRRPSAHH